MDASLWVAKTGLNAQQVRMRMINRCRLDAGAKAY